MCLGSHLAVPRRDRLRVRARVEVMDQETRVPSGSWIEFPPPLGGSVQVWQTRTIETSHEGEPYSFHGPGEVVPNNTLVLFTDERSRSGVSGHPMTVMQPTERPPLGTPPA